MVPKKRKWKVGGQVGGGALNGIVIGLEATQIHSI
jgi:hypothetical protein